MSERIDVIYIPETREVVIVVDGESIKLTDEERLMLAHTLLYPETNADRGAK